MTFQCSVCRLRRWTTWQWGLDQSGTNAPAYGYHRHEWRAVPLGPVLPYDFAVETGRITPPPTNGGLAWWERHAIGGWLMFVLYGIGMMAACLAFFPIIKMMWLLALLSLAVIVVTLPVWLFTLFIRPNLKGH